MGGGDPEHHGAGVVPGMAHTQHTHIPQLHFLVLFQERLSVSSVWSFVESPGYEQGWDKLDYDVSEGRRPGILESSKRIYEQEVLVNKWWVQK